ncbi:hypothetical protein BCR35DRAFT_325054 [Leucosporidium creatinivorum]|uniref:Alpha and gamma adaptin binding protein p34-domain-containing protein n=1 Tax=Leucosporidium creatinivorum TaxID=106004 RepID=A0A1Y2FD23_9BASI|nr:hypothetical protein BCR35DRAFT_325054 [Leucosporidium creatinivorum]
MASPLPAHATILLHHVAPLTASHARKHALDIRARGADEAQDAPTGDLRWTIKNKYYTADVGFRVLELLDQEGDGEEPAVIVLAAREELPHADLVPLLKRLSSRPAEFEVALLVSLPPTASALASASLEPNEEAWEDLAMEHGFEWVDLAPEDGSRVAVEDEDREETGLRRVVGALQAHMWEGMVPVARDGSTSKQTRNGHGEDGALSDEDDLSALGAPPLPQAKPFVPTPVSFPDTFLPSIKSKATTSSSTAAPSSTAAAASSPATAAAADSTFEDDFAPFVPALPSTQTSFPPLPPSLSTSGTTSASSPPISPLYRHPELAFPDTESPPSAARDDHEGEDGEEDLEAMFAKLVGVREEMKGLDMEARRALAERTVLGLFGGGDDDDDDE